MRRTILVAAILVALVAFVSTGEAQPAGDRWAVIVGIDDYQDLGKLTTARNDAKTLAQTLIENGGFAENRVILLTDDAAEPQNRPTLATMKRRIEQVAALAGKGDTLLVYFSGHGVTRKSNFNDSTSPEEGLLVPMVGDVDGALALSWLKDVLSKSQAKSKMLILDACHAGSAAKGVGGIAPSLVAETTGLVMLLSSAAGQVSYPDDDGTRSVFSKYLTEGLAGAADANGDNILTQAELLNFVRKRMTDWSLKTGKTQTPVAFPKVADEFALACLQPGAKVPIRPPAELRVPPGFKARAGTAAEPYSKTDWAKELVHEATGIELVFIPSGKFLMGSPVSEEVRSKDETQHEVTINQSFYMGKYEVTQGEWQKVMGNNPSNFKGSDRLPVEMVSWNDCRAFLVKAGGGLRLPTEAEWEYACRAGTRSPFNGGETISTDEANYAGNYVYGSGRKGEYRQKTMEVGSFRPNAWGLYDMHGNVWEWCADWNRMYRNWLNTDPTGPGSGTDRVLRGGGWGAVPRRCRSASRGKGNPDRRGIDVGFRVAVDLK